MYLGCMTSWRLRIVKTGSATCNVQMSDCANPKFSDDAEFPKSENLQYVCLITYVAAIYNSLRDLISKTIAALKIAD